jgi:3-oxoacyl-[acyl-carrier protein] reductase
MGRHFAVRLAEAGATVAVGDVNEAGLAETRALAAKARGTIVARRLDVSSEADVAGFVDWAHDALGGISALINNAGILRDGLLVKRDRATGQVQRLGREPWDAVIGVNLTGAMLLARDTVARMVGDLAGPPEPGTTRGVVVNAKAREALVAAVPVGRIGEPEDLWLAVKFVLECDYFNARTIDVDGGLSA